MNNAANIQKKFRHDPHVAKILEYNPKEIFIDTPVLPPLGNTVSYSANLKTSTIQKTDVELSKVKYEYKHLKSGRKFKLGKKVKSVGNCGTRPLDKNKSHVDVVKGQKGNIYFSGMQHCNSVWFCEDCGYKIMKQRSDEIYEQFQYYKEAGKVILFVTFTLQHKQNDSLEYLRKLLVDSFNYANSHRTWQGVKTHIQYVRVLEILFGKHGWHPHFHCAFIVDENDVDKINVFIDLYKNSLVKEDLIVNEHTVTVEKWNGSLNDMTDYMFKGMLEMELLGGNLKTSNKGKTFFNLIDEDNDIKTNEFIKEMKGKRQFHHSKNFFQDIKIKSDEEILKDDKVDTILFSIPIKIYNDIRKKGIALHLLNEYEYGGKERLIPFLELYDVDIGFLN